MSVLAFSRPEAGLCSFTGVAVPVVFRFRG
jgi:hypothetical protein